MKDLLQLMLEAQKEPDSKGRTLQDEEIVAQSVLFINGGYETTATTLALICYHLASYPDVQEKLYGEVIECWPEDDSLPNLDVRQKMNYMEMVISGVLRLYPPGRFFEYQKFKFLHSPSFLDISTNFLSLAVFCWNLVLLVSDTVFDMSPPRPPQISEY